MNDAEAIAAYRYRLREASRIALTMGDALLALSQDAKDPSTYELKELRDIENSLDVHTRITLKNLQDAAKASV